MQDTRPENWHISMVILHWLTAFGVISLYALGWYMVDLDYYDAWYQSAPYWHKGFGLSLFALVLLRLVVRVITQSPRPLAAHKQWEKHAASLVHITLYVLLLVCFISGYLISTADGRGIDVFTLFEVPALVPASFVEQYVENMEDWAGEVHEWSTNILLGMAAFHALGGLKHHLIDRDRTLSRMFTINRNSEES